MTLEIQTAELFARTRADQIMIAVTHVYQAHGGDPPTRAVAAAVISAAVDQVVPQEDSDPMDDELPLQRRCQRQRTRRQLLAIADELEAHPFANTGVSELEGATTPTESVSNHERKNSGYFFEPFVINRGFE
jgi:hypothetical protein